MIMAKGKRINGHQLNDHHVRHHGGETKQAPPYIVHRSPIHGRGVFARRTIPKGTRIIEYKGKVIPYTLACELYPDEEGQPTHTFLFELDEKTVIDAAQ